MTPLHGVGGLLFPRQFLAQLAVERPGADRAPDPVTRRLAHWWMRVEATCGPASGARLLFDEAAMPLFAQFGFRARSLDMRGSAALSHLETPRGTPVALLVLPWAARPSSAWRDVVRVSRGIGADWCFVLAGPYLSLVEARGQMLRRAVDFALPDALDAPAVHVLWRLCRATAFDGRDRRGAARAPVDHLVEAAARFRERVRDDLQAGVLRGLGALLRVLPRGLAGTRSASRAAPLDEALTIVYRLLFLFFAESRELVPCGHRVYREAYAVGRLAHEASRGGQATGLWQALAAITRLSRVGCHTDDLIVTPFNGRLFARSAAPSLERDRRLRPGRIAAARDRAMHDALVALATRHAPLAARHAPDGREDISYTDLGVEQLGAVYERVLDVDPESLTGAPAVAPGRRAGRGHSLRRKQTGTFYTPQALADFVVRRTLAPLVAGASADQVLALRVVDPSMGSGAFLVSACRYLSSAYERALVDEGRCEETDITDDVRADIRRLVAERCLAGVDANPTAVQLARLSLWLATLAHGKPLGFLDHRLRTGNSLIGAGPAELRELRETGGRRATAPLPLLEYADVESSLAAAARPLADLVRRRDETVLDVRAKETAWAVLAGDRSPLRRLRQAADLWCARWFWPDGRAPSAAEIRAALDAVLKDDPTLRAGTLARWLATSAALQRTQRFFHWRLEFPDVFFQQDGRPRERPGFDAVIGNPPWEMLRQDTANPRTPTASLVRFIRDSGVYAHCGGGHVNLYQPFLERALQLARPCGRVGLVLPWGLAVDDGAAALRAQLLDRCATDTVVGLDNGGGLFPIHRGLRFLALTTSPGRATDTVRARFGVKTDADLHALPDAADESANPDAAYPIRLTPALVGRIGGRTRRIPDARDGRDVDLLEAVTSRFPALADAAGWNARFGRELNATEDRRHFSAAGLPVIGGRHIQPFVVDAEAASDRIAPATAARLLPGGGYRRPRLAYRDVSGVGNRLALIAAIVPAQVVTTHTLFCLRTPAPGEAQEFLCALLNSDVLNAVARLLMGGHLTTSLVESLPAPAWTGSRAQRRTAALARRRGRRPGDERVERALQSAVAGLYGLEDALLQRVRELCRRRAR